MRRSVYTIIIYITWLLLPGLSMRAAEAQAMSGKDSVRLSLLTCGPGTEIYSLFGHTAIRYENRNRGVDVVFNYGLFSFDTPNFILRFTLGETDYQLGVTDFRRFLAGYWMEGRDVWQQTLNLTTEEKQRLIGQLEENYRPENRVYRYNFFYDNCATRPRDQVERATEDRLRYAEDMESTDTGRSFRDIVHQYCEGHPWARFGIDMCLGSEADRPINRRQMMCVRSCSLFFLIFFILLLPLRDKWSRQQRCHSLKCRLSLPDRFQCCAQHSVGSQYNSDTFLITAG